jgi:hypothetical protein
MFISVLTTSAWAGFKNNKTGWDGMSVSEKLGYVMGFFDEHTSLSTWDSQAVMDLKLHRQNCLIDMNMNSQGLVDLVDTMYRNDVGIWKHPPFVALIQGLHEMCGEP